MNTAVQGDQAPSSPPSKARFRPHTEERLISRVLFEMPDGTRHQTSIFSTLPVTLEPGTAETDARIADYTVIYEKLGARIIHLEFINQVGWELG